MWIKTMWGEWVNTERIGLLKVKRCMGKGEGFFITAVFSFPYPSLLEVAGPYDNKEAAQNDLDEFMVFLSIGQSYIKDIIDYPPLLRNQIRSEFHQVEGK